MRPEAIVPGEISRRVMRIDQQNLRARDGLSSSQEKRRRGTWRVWFPFALALIPAGIVAAAGFKFSELPDQVGFVFLLGVVLPAALICEALGLGQFRILGTTTIPDWALFGAMMLLVYFYCFGLVFVGRFLWWVGRRVSRVRGER